MMAKLPSNARRRSGALLAVGVVSMTLAACGSGAPSTPSSPSGTSGSSVATPPGNATSGTVTWGSAPIARTNLRPTLVKAFEKAYPHITVNIQSLPTSANAQQAALSTQISGGSGPDVYTGDVTWAAQFAKATLAEPLSRYLGSSYFSTFAPGLTKGASYQGKVYGAPFFTDEGLLYYRKDLLAQQHMAVPHTWAQLMSESKTLQKKGLVQYGYVWQGASYEGLTCDWVEFMADAGGKLTNSAATKSAIDSKASLQALTFMRSLITSGVSPAAVTTYQEPQSAAVFDSGHAAFMRFWPEGYAPAVSALGASKVGVAPLPSFSASSYPGYSVIGGQNLYLNPHAKNMAASLTFIKWLTGTQAQTIMAMQYKMVPSNAAVRSSKSVVGSSPVMAAVSKTRLIARPSYTPNYTRASQAIYSNVNAALSGSVSPASALKSAANQMNAALSGTGI